MPTKHNQNASVNSYIIMAVGKVCLISKNDHLENICQNKKWTCQTKTTQIPFSNREIDNETVEQNQQ